jgi:hypothetical protein
VSPALLAVTGGYLALVALLAVLTALGVRCRPAVQTGVVVGEIALIVQAVVDVAGVARGHRPTEPVVHVGYVLVSIAILPLLVGRMGGSPLDAEGDRMGLLVVALACAACVVVVTRMHVTWD